MKATMRIGKGSADHNDRKYLSATEQDKNEIISQWQLFKECDSFRENELKAYEQLFGEWLKGVNDRKIKDRHPEKCKTMEDILGKPNQDKKRTQYEPAETILQIGKNGEQVDEAVFRDCVNEFIGRTRDLYGTHMEWLDIAVHKENSSVLHAHARRVWYAYDKDGCAYPAKKEALHQLGQENAELLEQGFEIRKDDDRYNNATTRQTAAERALWYDICKAHGIQLEEEPDLDNIKHLHPKEYSKMQADKQKALQLIEDENRAEIEQARKDWELIKEYEERKAREKYSKAFDNQSLDDVIQDMNIGR